MRMLSSDPENQERAVSEVLAFILVFTIIIGSVTVVSVFGLQSLTSFQENEQVRNAERAFDSMSDNLNDVIRYDGITDRSGELNLREGTLTTSSEGTVLEIDGDEELEELGSIDLGRLEYQADRRSDTIAYEGGAIFRSDGEGSAALEQPQVRCGDDGGVVSLLVIDEPEDDQSFRSSGTTQVSVSEIQARESYSGDEIQITVDGGNYQNGWERALERAGFDGEDGEFECAGTEGEIIVEIVTVEIRI